MSGSAGVDATLFGTPEHRMRTTKTQEQCYATLASRRRSPSRPGTTASAATAGPRLERTGRQLVVSRPRGRGRPGTCRHRIRPPNRPAPGSPAASTPVMRPSRLARMAILQRPPEARSPPRSPRSPRPASGLPPLAHSERFGYAMPPLTTPRTGVEVDVGVDVTELLEAVRPASGAPLVPVAVFGADPRPVVVQVPPASEGRLGRVVHDRLLLARVTGTCARSWQ
jgi:hypothetical protein